LYIIPDKSGKRAFDVKISDGNIVCIIYIYMTQIYDLHNDFRYIPHRAYTYRCSTPLHKPTCIHHSNTHTPTNTLVKTLNASNGHSPYTTYNIYVYKNEYRRARGEKSRGVVFLFARGVRPPFGHRGEGCSRARIDV